MNSFDKFRSARQVQQSAESRVGQIAVNDIVAYDDHPFEIKEERVEELVQSIRLNGILEPLLVRVHPEQRGKYECIAGHHRLEAARRLNLETVPAIIRAMTDTEADLAMVDTNIQRGFADLKPTEIGRIMKVRWEAMKHQGKKIEAETDTQTGLGMNERTARRYIRLTYLIPELAEAVDSKKLSLLSGEALSYLPSAMQYTIATKVELSSLTKDIALAYRERYEAGKPFEILMRLPDMMTGSGSQELPDSVTESSNQELPDSVTESSNQELPDSVTGSKSQELPDTVTRSENQEPPDSVTGSENQESSDTIPGNETKELPVTVTGSGNRDFIIKALRHLGEESVFKNLVLMYQSKKEWIAELKKSHLSLLNDEVGLHCESAGISIEDGDEKLVTVLAYSQAYDIISDLIREGKWLPKMKMLELAKKYWE